MKRFRTFHLSGSGKKLSLTSTLCSSFQRSSGFHRHEVFLKQPFNVNVTAKAAVTSCKNGGCFGLALVDRNQVPDLSLLDNDTSWWFQRLWNICQNGNFPQVGAKIRNIRSHHLGYFYCQTKAHTAHSSTCTGASVHLQVVDSCATPQIQIAPNWMLDMPYTLGPQNHERWRFYTHKIWVITHKMKVVGSDGIIYIFLCRRKTPYL